MTIGLQGLRTAEARFAQAAFNLVTGLGARPAQSSGIEIASAVAPTLRTESVSKGRAPAAYLPAGLTPGSIGAFEEAIVDMRLAANAYGASAAVISTADEMARTLLDVVA